MSISSTTVVATFNCHPGQVRPWTALWSALAQAALMLPDCEGFSVLPSATEDGRAAVVSRWTDPAGFDRFVRKAGLIWLKEALYLPVVPVKIDRYKSLSGEVIETAIRRQPAAPVGAA